MILSDDPNIDIRTLPVNSQHLEQELAGIASRLSLIEENRRDFHRPPQAISLADAKMAREIKALNEAHDRMAEDLDQMLAVLSSLNQLVSRVIVPAVEQLSIGED